MTPRLRALARTMVVCVALVLMASSCAHSPPRQQRGVPVDSRPTPPQPPPEPTGTSTAPTTPAQPAQPKVETAMTPEQRRQSIARVVADTTAASAAVKKCATRKLLPDQESVFDTVRSLLMQTRAALGRSELWNAESLARKARQLASSLDCP